MSHVPPKSIHWHRTESWSADVFGMPVIVMANEDRVLVSVDRAKLFEFGLIADDLVLALVYEQGEVAQSLRLSVEQAEGAVKDLSTAFGGLRRSTNERWRCSLALGDIAMRAWSAHLSMRRKPEVADTPLRPLSAEQEEKVETAFARLRDEHPPESVEASSSEFTRTVH